MLPASVTTWAVDLTGEVGVGKGLVVGGRFPLVYSIANIESASICDWGGMCDDVVGAGDISAWVRAVREEGRAVGTIGLEATNAAGYRHGLDDLAAPGDGNNDLGAFASGGAAWGLGGVQMRGMAGARLEAGLGPPPPAWEVELQASARRGPVEVGLSWSRYDSLGGLAFDTATSTDVFH